MFKDAGYERRTQRRSADQQAEHDEARQEDGGEANKASRQRYAAEDRPLAPLQGLHVIRGPPKCSSKEWSRMQWLRWALGECAVCACFFWRRMDEGTYACYDSSYGVSAARMAAKYGVRLQGVVGGGVVPRGGTHVSLAQPFHVGEPRKGRLSRRSRGRGEANTMVFRSGGSAGGPGAWD